MTPVATGVWMVLEDGEFHPLRCAKRGWNLSLTAGRAEAAGAASCIGQVAFFDFDGFVTGDDHLGDAVAFVDLVGLAAEVDEDDFDFAAVAGVNGAGAVGDADGVFEGEAGAGADLRFETGGKLNGKAGRNGLGDVWFEEGVGDGTEVHAGVFVGAVRVFGNNGVGVEFTNAKYHWKVEIPVCLIA